MSDLTEADINMIHPDYPTQPEVLNVMYREHAERVRDYFQAQSKPHSDRLGVAKSLIRQALKLHYDQMPSETWTDEAKRWLAAVTAPNATHSPEQPPTGTDTHASPS